MRFERRPKIEIIRRETGILRDRVIPRMLDDSLADAKREIQTSMRCISLLEVLADAQCMKVVVETKSMAFETLIEGSLASMPKRRVTNVVHKRQSLDQIFIKPESVRDIPGNLGDLDCMSQARTEMI